MRRPCLAIKGRRPPGSVLHSSPRALITLLSLLLFGVYCSDFRSAWFGLANSTEQYILRYESKYLREMGQVLDYLVSVGVSAAVQETLKYTVLSSMYHTH